MVNAQLSKNIKKVWHIYTGVENLFNYMQRPAVIDAHNPFGNYFDASLIWGPAMGRNIYVGVNYKLDK
jgi:outer membrane receptor protein involved in Fe transport